MAGKVVDKDGAPLAFVDVWLEGEGSNYAESDLTEEDGSFAFTHVPAGTYRLYAFSQGLVSDKLTGIVVGQGTIRSYTIQLKPAQACVLEVEVRSAELAMLDPKVTGKRSTLDDRVRRTPLQSKRIQDVVNLFPGVVRSGASASEGAAIGGGTSSETSYVLNGASGSHPLDGGLRFAIPTESIAQVKMITTGFSAPYGEHSTGLAAIVQGNGARNSFPPPACPAPEPPAADREAYAHVEENRFMDVAQSPVTTFSIDVDTASYSNVRRFLRAGTLPPAAAVRVEEMVNYFRYDRPPAEPGKPFGVAADVAECPWEPAHRLVRIVLSGHDPSGLASAPRNLVFLVDTSGSMQEPNKLPLVQESLKLLADELTARDSIALVAYAGSAGLVLPTTSGSDSATVRGAIDALRSGGSTNGAGGIRLAYEQARSAFKEHGVNRVVLATDGDFNVGVSSEGELVKLIEEERRDGIFLTVLGYGTGNLQDSKMEALADHGNGNYAYVDGLAEARKVLVDDMDATLVAVAKDVKVQVEWNPAEVAGYRLVGYENRMLRNEDFADDAKDAGELGAGHAVTVLYEVVPARSAAAAPMAEPLRYQQPAGLTDAARSGELLVLRLRYKEPTGDTSELAEYPVADDGGSLASAPDDLRFAAAVATFGLLMRGSETCDATWKDVVKLASSSLGADPGGLRAELVELARTAERLAPGRESADAAGQ